MWQLQEKNVTSQLQEEDVGWWSEEGNMGVVTGGKCGGGRERKSEGGLGSKMSGGDQGRKTWGVAGERRCGGGLRKEDRGNGWGRKTGGMAGEGKNAKVVDEEGPTGITTPCPETLIIPLAHVVY